MGVAKVSITVSESDLRWIRQQAKKNHRSVSAEFAESLRLRRQQEARLRVLEYLGDAAKLTDGDRAVVYTSDFEDLSRLQRHFAGVRVLSV